ncbi:MAG: Asp23/Gls24 family envelope stress response protein [Christensenellaceae bacterium]|jgi:uncharacterized alkaline shock family protein YloU
MSEQLANVATNTVNGTVTFADEVLEIIAGIAAADIPGVAGMSGGIRDGIAELLGRKNFTKGIKVTKTDDALVFDIQIIVEYGVRVPEVCENIQKSVSTAIDTMTGLKPTAINIAIQGIKLKEAVVETSKDDKKS